MCDVNYFFSPTNRYSFSEKLFKGNIMKKHLIIFIILSFTGISVFSQGVRFGIFAEPKIIWFTPDLNTSYENEGVRMGFNAGLMMDNYFTENYAFSTGVSINNISGALITTAPREMETESGTIALADDTKAIYKLQYVNVPLGLNLRTNPIGYWTFNSRVGVTSAFNVKSRIDSKENDINNGDLQEEINLYNLGYHFGAGVEYSLGGSSALSLMVMYRNYFLDITKSEDDNMTFSNISLKVGLIF